MPNRKSKLSISDLLHNAVKEKDTDSISIEELKISLHERGFAILMIVFALPVSVPIPYIPGITTIFAIPLLFLASQMCIGLEFPWLPKWVAKRSIKRTTLSYIIVKSAPIIKKAERVLKPRLTILSTHQGARVIGFFSIIFAISIALPLPFTNFIPAIGIITMSLGLIGRDGIIILLGMLIGLIGVVFTIAVMLFGKKIVIGIVKSIF